MSSIPDPILVSASIASRAVWEAAKDIIEPEQMLENAAALWSRICEFYEGDPAAQALDRELLQSAVKNAAASSKIADAQIEWMMLLPTVTSTPNVRALCHSIRKRKLKLALVDAMLADSHKEQGLLHEYKDFCDSLTSGEEVKTQLSADDLLASQSGKVRVYPDQLNAVLNGGLRRGDTQLNFGRPGAGKTLLTVNMCAGWAMQNLRGLYIGNEEGLHTLTRRFLSLMGGELLRDLDSADEALTAAATRRAMDKANKRGLQNIHIVHGVTEYSAVRFWVKKLKPDFVVLDQLRNMSMGSESMTKDMERAMQIYRGDANKSQFIGVAVAQAGPEADGRAVLGLNHIADSKTGVQGAVDVIAGVGLNEEMQRDGKRVISICRNKVSGIITNFPVFIDEQRTLIKKQ